MSAQLKTVALIKDEIKSSTFEQHCSSFINQSFILGSSVGLHVT